VVVPNDVEVPDGPGRRHVNSLSELDVDELRGVFALLADERGQQTA
jgi:hypothetical protein